MKISILIPVFNFDVSDLVEELENQCQSAHTLEDFEIRLYDDGSANHFSNSKLRSDKIIFKEFSENQGRSRIRNTLAKEAAFEALLFLDCDSRIDQKDFIKNYVQNYQDGSVVYGGRTYDKSPPESTFYFRWKYGLEREIISADIRIQNPYRSFMTNNFLIDRLVFNQIGLDEGLKGYGHEDTLLGIELEKKEIPIIHIDNPAAHIGLESKEDFLNKTKEGLKNLLLLFEQSKLKSKDVRILKYYTYFRIFPVKQIFLKYYSLRKRSIEKNLSSKEVEMKNFDLYKLNYLLNLESS